MHGLQRFVEEAMGKTSGIADGGQYMAWRVE